MITVAKRLLEDPVFNNPTVIMLVDRNELEQQLFWQPGSRWICASPGSKQQATSLRTTEKRLQGTYSFNDT